MRNDCNCPTESASCRGGRLERPRYFPRQLITPAEMNLAQDYFRHRLRLHNRMLHGWGVVCGALVCPVPRTDGSGYEPWRVKLERGYVLGPCGDEIYIDCEHSIDLRTTGLAGAPGEPAEHSDSDPWCSEVFVPREAGPLFVAVKYDQRMTRPVRAQPTGCGCDDDSCEYSRWRDGYVVGVLDECPPSHDGTPPDCGTLCDGTNPPCPPCCPDDPWVVLAEVTLHDDGTIDRIDNCSCRRVVASPGRFWWRCGDPAYEGPVDIREVRVQGRPLPGGTAGVEVLGHNFEGLRYTGVSVGAGVGVSSRAFRVEPGLLTFTVQIEADADPGVRALTIESPNGTVARYDDALTISAPDAAAARASARKAGEPAKTAKKPATKKASARRKAAKATPPKKES